MGQEYTGYRTWLAFCGECCEQEQAAREGLDGKRWIAEDKEDTHAKKKKKGGPPLHGCGSHCCIAGQCGRDPGTLLTTYSLKPRAVLARSTRAIKFSKDSRFAQLVGGAWKMVSWGQSAPVAGV